MDPRSRRVRISRCLFLPSTELQYVVTQWLPVRETRCPRFRRVHFFRTGALPVLLIYCNLLYPGTHPAVKRRWREKLPARRNQAFFERQGGKGDFFNSNCSPGETRQIIAVGVCVREGK